MTIDTTRSTIERTGSPLDELRGKIAGRLFVPGDPDWDLVRTPWAVNINQTPLAVIQVAGADDVELAVGWANEYGHQVTAQPVGHGAYDGLDGVLLLRTRALNSIHLDLAAGTATIGAGVKVGELLVVLQDTGWTFLAGSNNDPTVVGMTIGGGLSWFGRKYGQAANRIISADLIDGLGRRRRVTQADEPDLFWAIRGGGGDFGIITSLQIQLVPGPELYAGQLLWPVEHMPTVLRTFRQVTGTAPDRLSLWYSTIRFPPFPDIPDVFRGKSFATVAATYLGSAKEAQHLLQPLQDLPGIVADSLRTMPMMDLGLVTNEPTDPMPTMEHSMFLGDLSDEVIDRLTTVAGDASGSPLLMLQIRHLGGAFRRHHPADGAAGDLQEPYLLFALGVPAVPALVDALNDTFTSLDQAVAGHTSDQTVPNFLNPGGDIDRIWSPQTRHRLAAIKKVTDPRSTIRSNRTVRQMVT